MEPLEIGAVTLWPFGAAAALCLAGGAVRSLRAARGEREKKALELFWLLALPLGLFLAHLGWALCSLDMIEDEFFEILLNFPGGGYLLYGALAGAAAALGIACGITKASFARAADLLAGPFLLFGAGCALAEGLIGAGTGWKVEDWFNAENNMSLLASEEPEGLVSFFSSFPFAVRDPYYGYPSWAVFLPMGLFLLAALVLTERRKPGRPGNRAVLALSLYAAARVLYESLRQDDIPRWGFVRVNQILSAVLLLILLLLAWRKAGKGLGVSLALLFGGVILAGGMEFALEGKISLLEWMPMDLCYAVSALGCGLLFLSVNRLRRAGLEGKEEVDR